MPEPENKITLLDNSIQVTPCHAKYVAYELTLRSPSDSIQKLASTLLDAQVDLNPHQVEAALFAFRSPLKNGTVLDQDHCHRFFSLNGEVGKREEQINLPPEIKNLLKRAAETITDQFFLRNSLRNAGFFDEELIKLEKWAENKKSSLEIEVKQLIEIKTLKAEARKLPRLEEKVKAQRHIKEMEKHRNEMRKNLFQHQDEVDQRKENLIAGIEVRLKQLISINELFTIRWTII